MNVCSEFIEKAEGLGVTDEDLLVALSASRVFQMAICGGSKAASSVVHEVNSQYAQSKTAAVSRGETVDADRIVRKHEVLMGSLLYS